jgi:uncharacterized membrane protein YagU involved in acid resistance
VVAGGAVVSAGALVSAGAVVSAGGAVGAVVSAGTAVSFPSRSKENRYKIYPKAATTNAAMIHSMDFFETFDLFDLYFIIIYLYFLGGTPVIRIRFADSRPLPALRGISIY